MKAENILHTIGNTSYQAIPALSQTRSLDKSERQSWRVNQDRIALAMVEDAESLVLYCPVVQSLSQPVVTRV